MCRIRAQQSTREDEAGGVRRQVLLESVGEIACWVRLAGGWFRYAATRGRVRHRRPTGVRVRVATIKLHEVFQLVVSRPG
jgi:hypothetical protein